MKSLLTRRPNFLLIIWVKLKGSRKLVIPIPLWVLEESMEAVGDLAWLFQRIFRAWARNPQQGSRQKWTAYAAGMPVSASIDLVAELVRDLRKLGRFRMVEVEDKDLRVYIDLF